MKKMQAPITTEGKPGSHSDSVTTHPAFGQIGASRVQSSGLALYDSGFKHQHFMTIKVYKSEQHRGLSRDYHHVTEQLFEVSLSEAQWATFVSSPNAGMGVPCTLEYVMGKSIPGIEMTRDVAGEFKDEMHTVLKEIQESLNKLAADKRLPAWAKKEIDMQAHRLTGSTGFVASQFSEHIEDTVERAKIEVNAYTTAMIQRAGLEALTGGKPPVELIDKQIQCEECGTEHSIDKGCP